MKSQLQFKNIKAFYPYYLSQHYNNKSRAMHFVGTGLVISLFIAALVTQIWWLFAIIPIVGYGFAWFGHYVFDKNKPAAFKNPLWSLACDFIMFKDIVTGKIDGKLVQAAEQYKEYI